LHGQNSVAEAGDIGKRGCLGDQACLEAWPVDDMTEAAGLGGGMAFEQGIAAPGRVAGLGLPMGGIGEESAQAQFIEQWQRGGGEAFARLILEYGFWRDPCDRNALLRQRQGGGAAGNAAADDGDGPMGSRGR